MKNEFVIDCNVNPQEINVRGAHNEKLIYHQKNGIIKYGVIEEQFHFSENQGFFDSEPPSRTVHRVIKNLRRRGKKLANANYLSFLLEKKKRIKKFVGNSSAIYLFGGDLYHSPGSTYVIGLKYCYANKEWFPRFVNVDEEFNGSGNIRKDYCIVYFDPVSPKVTKPQNS